MFSSYFDDSQDREHRVLAVVAGWVVEEYAGLAFDEAWTKVLVRRGIDEFKAADCEGGFHAFKHRSDRDELRDTLVALIEDYGLVGVAGALNIAECRPAIDQLRAIMAHRQRQYARGRRIPVEYLLCMQYCLVEAYRMTPEGERLAVTFDTQAKAVGHVQALSRLLRACRAFDVADRVSAHEPQARDSESLPGLQAADFLAYEVLRHGRAQLEQSPTSRRWWDRLEPLVVHQRYFNGDEIQAVVREYGTLVGDDASAKQADEFFQ